MKSVYNDMSAGHGAGKVIGMVDCSKENGSFESFCGMNMELYAQFNHIILSDYCFLKL